MRDITIKDEGSKRTILQRGTRPQQSHQFFKTIFEAWEEGYKLPEDPKRDELSLRNYRGVLVGKCVLFKELDNKENTQKEKPVTPTKKAGRPKKSV